MATFRSNRLTRVVVYDLKTGLTVQAIQFGRRLVGHVAAPFVHLQDKALWVERVFCQPDATRQGQLT